MNGESCGLVCRFRFDSNMNKGSCLFLVRLELGMSLCLWMNGMVGALCFVCFAVILPGRQSIQRMNMRSGL